MSTDNNNIPEFFGSAFIVGHRKVREFLEHNPGPVFIQVSPCTGDHVRVVKQHLTHPHVAKMQEREAEPLPFSTFLKF